MNLDFYQAQHQTRRIRGKRRQYAQTGRNVVLYVVLIALAAIFIGPILWLVNIALESPAELGTDVIHWLPAAPQWDNFVQAVTRIPFWQELLNSLEISLIYATLVTLSSATVGFGFARLRAPGKRPLFFVMISMMLLPGIITLLPIYIFYSRLGLLGTYWPWVFGGLASTPFLSFLFRQFFSALPKELEEAAILDGAKYLRIFTQLFLPLSGPVLATSFVLSFTWTWGDYVTPSLLLNGDSTTLSVGIVSGYLTYSGVPVTNLVAAGALFYILPMLILFFFAQRAFTRGIVTSGLKG